MSIDVINALNKIEYYGNDVLYKILNESNNENTIERIRSLQVLISKLPNLIPEDIYVKYESFFKDLIVLCDGFDSTIELQKNGEILSNAMAVFFDNMKDIQQEINHTYVYDSVLENLFKGMQLEKAREGFRLYNCTNRDFLHKWVSYYCPQVICVDGNLGDIEDKFDMIVCGFDSYDNGVVQKIMDDNIDDLGIIITPHLIEGDNFYTHLLSGDGAPDIYVLSKQEDYNFDLSHSWEVDKDLCESGPLVSVIMSCYNHERFVAEAIESVINQSYKNIEFIIADDASPDKTAEIMSRYEQYYAKCIYYKENAGGRTAELKKYATGKYIAMMHSDDVWHEDKIALQVEYMEKHKECGVCLSWCRNIDIDGNIMEDQLFIQPNRSQTQWMSIFWNEGNCLCNPSSLSRREYFFYEQKYGVSCRQLPDLFKWIDLVQKTPIHIITKDLIYMRRYVLVDVENTSIDSRENNINAHIELGAIWPLYIKTMEDEFFIRTFNMQFVNRKAHTREEILCEKYFLMLKHSSQFVQNSAISFYNEIYNQARECFVSKYNYTVKDFRRDVRERGLAKVIEQSI